MNQFHGGESIYNKYIQIIQDSSESFEDEVLS